MSTKEEGYKYHDNMLKMIRSEIHRLETATIKGGGKYIYSKLTHHFCGIQPVARLAAVISSNLFTYWKQIKFTISN